MGDEGLYLPNCQINLVISFHALSLFGIFLTQQLTTWAAPSLHRLLLKSSIAQPSSHHLLRLSYQLTVVARWQVPQPGPVRPQVRDPLQRVNGVPCLPHVS